MSTPGQPSPTAWDTSFAASGMAQFPHPGIKAAGSMPDCTRASSNDIRSSNDREFASLVVPNTAKPCAPSSSNSRHRLVNLGTSTSSPTVKGVNTGTNNAGVLPYKQATVTFPSTPACASREMPRPPRWRPRWKVRPLAGRSWSNGLSQAASDHAQLPHA